MAKKVTKVEMAGSLRDAAAVTIGGAILGRVSVGFSGSLPEPYHGVRIGFVMTQSHSDPDRDPTVSQFTEPGIFEQHVITAADVGKTLYEDATTDPNFVKVAARLSNGIANIVFFRWKFPPDAPFRGVGGIGLGDEPYAFKDSDLSYGIDFAGEKIARVGMRIDHLRFFSAYEEVGGQKAETYWHVGHVTFLIEREGTLKPR
jgi:hypothetical protein